MKTLTAIFSILLVLAFFGCQESSINQPETSPNTGINKTVPGESNAFNPITKGEINICCPTFDPLSGDCKINGKVTYTQNILEFIAGTSKTRLNLEMDAELCTRLMSPMKFSIYGISTDTLFIDENGKLLLDKTYMVTFRPDLRLCVEYLITMNNVSLMQMNLLQVFN